MKVLVAGGTGVLGRRAVPAMLAAGHDLVVASRRPDSDEWLRGIDAQPIRLDVFDPDAATAAASGVDAVVNLATAIPTGVALRRRDWAPNDRLRRDGSRALSTAAIRHGIRYVQESFAPTYPDMGADWITEDVPLAPQDQTMTVLDAEASAAAVTEAGSPGVVLRFGLFYDASSPQTRQTVDMARKGRLMLPGGANDWVSMIHVMDAGDAVVAALSLPAGTYNVVDDQPVTRATLARVLADLVGVPRVRLLPGFLAKLPMLRVISRSQRMDNARLEEASAWRPAHPTVREGWAQILEELADGQ